MINSSKIKKDYRKICHFCKCKNSQMTVIHHEAFYLTSFCHLVIQEIHKQKTQRGLYYRHCYVI